MSDDLEMRFNPKTIEHLGARLYSQLPPVLAELIANAYDADASKVKLTLKDEDGSEKEIIVEDDGEGMSFEEINEEFLQIGRNRREKQKSEKTAKGRMIIGKKGLGKLSFFGIALEIEISTKKNGKENVFRMVWEDIMKEEDTYKPTIVKRNATCSPDVSGTKITLWRIERKSRFSPEDIAKSLSRLFIIDPDFQIEIIHNAGDVIKVSNEMRYADLDIEFEWEIPKNYKGKGNYFGAQKITGRLIATKKPIKPNMRGITLFSRSKLVNLPESFSPGGTSSHFFSYLTGELRVDFIDYLRPDVIATSRQSLNWEHEETRKLQERLIELVKWLERDWRKKRNEKRNQEIDDAAGINIAKWLKTVPSKLHKPVRFLLKAFVESEMPDDKRTKAVKNIYAVLPLYPLYHWRHLHREVKSASKKYYEKGDYYKAAEEALKRYMKVVKRKSGYSKKADRSMMFDVFGPGKKLQVAAQKSQGYQFDQDTIDNIENGQKFLSGGVVAGFRNPLNHEEIEDLKDSGLFTKSDCLDLLSLLSHLFRRLDDA